jgi:peptidoglycan hydrolase FlgJ
MPFNPSTDVVLDVLNAADPARASMAAERLAALGAGAPASDFALDLDKAAASPATASQPLPAGLANARTALADASDPAAKAKVEFEAMLLNSFVGEMLPKESSAFFGEGTSGDVWRSMLSEQISKQIAKSGALGLSRRLFATHDIAAGGRAVGATGAERAAAAVESSGNILSAPEAANVVNGGVLTAVRRRA